MRPGLKVGVFVAGLVVVGGLGAALGAAVGPIDTGSSDDEHTEEGHDTSTSTTEPAHDAHEAAPGSGSTTAADALGTTSEQDGYRLVLDDRLVLDPPDDELRFRVLDPAGEPIVATEVVHDRPLHLIVVGHDLRSYHHLHPEVADDGTWSVAWPDLAPGAHRVVADLTPEGGPALVLGADVTVPGEVATVAVPPVAALAEVDDLDVALTGTPEVGDTELTFAVTRGGEPVALEPYLGARGHLVAIRTSDLAYSHVHPHDGDEGPVAFTATFASAGTHRLFLDISVDGEVRTASFTVEVPEPDAGAAPDATAPDPADPADTTTTASHEDDHEH